MPYPYLYPYDPSGSLVSNLVANESHTVVAPTDPQEANFIVPEASPFFASSIVIRTGPLPTDPVLTEGVDYELRHWFIEASNALAVPVYGSIKFINQSYAGTVYLTYQTLGGPYTLADYSIVESLTRSLYHIEVVTWTQIAGLPAAFPPSPHPTPAPDLTGMQEVIDKLDEMITAILTAPSGGLGAALNNHLTAPSGAHTPAQVGLGNVPNFGVATLPELLSWASNKLVVPSVLQGLLLPQNPPVGQILVGTGTGFALAEPTDIYQRANAFLYHMYPHTLTLEVRNPGLIIEDKVRMGDATLNISAVGTGTTWLVYASWDGSGVVLEISTTDFVRSTTNPYVFVKQDDATQTLVGMVFKNDDGVFHTRSVYVDNRQYTEFTNSPFTHPDLVTPYRGRRLTSNQPYWTATSSEWTNPSSASDISGIEIPVLLFANERKRVDFNVNLNYSVDYWGGATVGTLMVVGQITTPTSSRTSNPVQPHAKYEMDNTFAGGSGDFSVYCHVNGHFVTASSQVSRVEYVWLRAAKSHDTTATLDMDLHNSIQSFLYQRSGYWLDEIGGFKRSDDPVGYPPFDSAEHTYLSIIEDKESFNMRAFANHL